MSQANIQIPVTTTNYRDTSDAISPSWLNATNGQKFRYSLAVMYDTLGDAAGYAARVRFPTYAPVDAFPYLGQDRVLSQGLNEPGISYVGRLIQWLDLWRHAGSNMAVLLASLATMAPLTPKVVAVQTGVSANYGSVSPTSVTKWETYAAGAAPFPAGQTNPTPPSIFVHQPANWIWDWAAPPFGFPRVTWRTWIIVFSPAGSPWSPPTAQWSPATGVQTVRVSSDLTYGTRYIVSGGTGVPTYPFYYSDGQTCWGWGGSHQQALALTTAVRTWKSAGVWIPFVLVTYDGTLFDQTLAYGSGKLPDGEWGCWGMSTPDATYGSVYTRARPSESTVAFIDGSSSLTQGYSL
jgi:hypothetical protein